jgi:hypothetical protein
VGACFDVTVLAWRKYATVCLLKKSGYLQMLPAAMTHLADITDITDVRSVKVSNLLSGYMETNSIHNRTTDNFVLEHVNNK